MSRVVLGISGGFDSAVSAWMLQRDGHDVVAVTLLFSDVPADTAKYQMARDVCAKLGLEHHELDVRADYSREVMERFAALATQGLAPDPFVFQNQLVLRELFAARERYGCDLVATGHYAAIESDQDAFGALPLQLVMPRDTFHDQTYYLYGLSQQDLALMTFPLWNTPKPVARMQAMRAGLMLAQFEEEERVGFLKDASEQEWLEASAGLAAQEGPILHVTTRQQLGVHQGLHRNRIGSALTGVSGPGGEQMHVVALDTVSNAVLAGPKPLTGAEQLLVRDANWVSVEAPEQKRSCKARLAQGRKPVPVQVVPTQQGVVVTFNEAVYGLASQSPVVFYSDRLVLGGGMAV